MYRVQRHSLIIAGCDSIPWDALTGLMTYPICHASPTYPLPMLLIFSVVRVQHPTVAHAAFPCCAPIYSI
jgi:hypothetical protein